MKKNPIDENGVHTDTEEARELFFFAVSDGDLYRQRITPIIDNLKKKIKKGTYDKVLAVKLWRYAADDAAKAYLKEFMGTRAGFGIFTVPIRNEVATLLQEQYDEELHYGGNPVPRSSVARAKYVNKKSQITRSAPTPRLKKRRAKNTERGYFPNPTIQESVLRFYVDVRVKGSEEWFTVAKTNSIENAKEFAEHYAKKNPHLFVRVSDGK